MIRTVFGKMLPIAVIIFTLALGGYDVYRAYVAIRLADAVVAAQKASLDAQKGKLRKQLASVKGLSALMVERGFWYSYKDANGNESVYYFNLDSAAADNLSDSQIASLAAHVASSSVLTEGSITQVADDKLPPNLQFHNQLYTSAIDGASTIEMQGQLRKKVAAPDATSQDLLQLSYLSELNGDYAARDALNKQNCTRFKERCADDIQLKILGRVIDGNGDPIEGANVDIVSRPDVSAATTDQNGMYVIHTGAKKLEKMRIHAVKRNFSDGYDDVVLLQGSGAQTSTIDDITLESPIGIVTVDFVHHSVTGSGNSFNQDGSETIKTARSTYQIPKGAIVHESGSPYTGNTVDVYLYEFSKGNPPLNLIQLDTFDAVRGYAGNLMKSFGMPYIQFFAPGGEELHVLSSNPMVLTYRISDMDALRNNTDHIYRALTDADMQLLVDASKGQLYRIDRQFLIDKQMLQFPAFWVFDRKRGVWDNVGVSVLDTQGTIQSVFYTIRNAI